MGKKASEKKAKANTPEKLCNAKAKKTLLCNQRIQDAMKAHDKLSKLSKACKKALKKKPCKGGIGCIIKKEVKKEEKKVEHRKKKKEKKDKAKDEKRSKQIKKLAAKDAAKMEQGMDKKGSEISQKKAASKAQLKKMKDICINKGYRACVHKQHVSKAKIEAQYKKGGPHFGKVVPQKAIKK